MEISACSEYVCVNVKDDNAYSSTTYQMVGRVYRPLSRRLDRCDRMIQNESRDPNGSNVCLFSAAMCTSQCKLRSLHADASLFALIYTFRVSSLTLDCNGVFAIKT